MRVESVADIKPTKKGRVRKSSGDGLPHEGSSIRQLYDVFKENAGYVIKFDPMVTRQWTRFYAQINQLRDFYGCDIRKVGGYGAREYILAGEWIGAYYTDYVKARFDKA